MPEFASEVHARYPEALVRVFKVLDTECSSINKRLKDGELNLELQPLTQSGAINDYWLPPLHTLTHPLHRYLSSVGFRFIYFCKISCPLEPPTNRYGLAAGSLPGTIEVAEFKTPLELNSTSAAGNSKKELLRSAFQTIDEHLLGELARLEYCPEECKLDRDVGASSSAQGKNDKICNNCAYVTTTQRPSPRAPDKQSVKSTETNWAVLVALIVLSALVVWALKLLCCVASTSGGARHRDERQEHNYEYIELQEMTGRAGLSRPAGEVRVESETALWCDSIQFWAAKRRELARNDLAS
jgi:hypothetical protein